MGEIAGVDANTNRNIDNKFNMEETKKKEDLEEIVLEVERVEKTEQREIDERRLKENNEERIKDRAMRERGIGNQIDDMV